MQATNSRQAGQRARPPCPKISKGLKNLVTPGRWNVSIPNVSTFTGCPRWIRYILKGYYDFILSLGYFPLNFYPGNMCIFILISGIIFVWNFQRVHLYDLAYFPNFEAIPKPQSWKIEKNPDYQNTCQHKNEGKILESWHQKQSHSNPLECTQSIFDTLYFNFWYNLYLLNSSSIKILE